MKSLLSIVFSVCLMEVALVSCGSSSKKPDAVSDSNQSSLSQPITQFPYPDIPTMLVQPEERKEFLLNHYWDNFPFSDTTALKKPDVTEQGYVNYIALLADDETTNELRKEALDKFCARFTQDKQAFKAFSKLADDYLANPNSPQYNESLYALYLQAMIDCSSVDDVRKSTFRFKLDLISRNNPGDKASDFVYILPGSKRSSLMQTKAKGNKLLLIFYDPDCPHCREIMSQMIADRALSDAIDAEKVTVLAVYTEGDETVWTNTLPDMPRNWIVATDRSAIKDKSLYDLKAMPSLYLLDGSKTVILKDAPYTRIRHELNFD